MKISKGIVKKRALVGIVLILMISGLVGVIALQYSRSQLTLKAKNFGDPMVWQKVQEKSQSLVAGLKHEDSGQDKETTPELSRQEKEIMAIKEASTFKDGIYSNEYLSIEERLPQGWYAPTKEEIDSLIHIGGEVSKSAMETGDGLSVAEEGEDVDYALDEPISIDLFLFFRYPLFEGHVFNDSIIALAEPEAYYESNQAAIEAIINIYKEQEVDLIIEELEESVIDGYEVTSLIMPSLGSDIRQSIRMKTSKGYRVTIMTNEIIPKENIDGEN